MQNWDGIGFTDLDFEIDGDGLRIIYEYVPQGGDGSFKARKSRRGWFLGMMDGRANPLMDR